MSKAVKKVGDAIGDIGKAVISPFIALHEYGFKALKKGFESLFVPDMPSMGGSNEASEPSATTIRSSKAPARYLVGTFATGGALVFAQEQAGSQTEGEWLHCVYTLSEGSIEAVDEVYLDEKPISSYGSNVEHAFIQGATSANQFLLNNCPDWKPEQIGKGLAYYRISYRYDPEVFSGGLPSLRFEGRGRNDIYDPRDQSTDYSANPALIALWYLRTVLGVPDDEIIMQSFADAAAICDEVVTNPDGSTSTRYTMGAVIGDNQPVPTVLKEIMKACAGKLVRVGGRWHCQAGAYYGPADFTITESMVVGEVSGQTEISNDDAANVIHGKFIDPEQTYSETDYPPVRDTAAIAEDGAEVPVDFDLKYVQNPYQAQRLASIELRRRRQGGAISLRLNANGYNCRPGRVINVDLPKLNISGEFVVKDWGMGSNGECNVQLAGYDADMFDDAVGKPYTPLGFVTLPSGGIGTPNNLQFTPQDNAEVNQGLLTWEPPLGVVEYYGVTIRDNQGDAVVTYQPTGDAVSQVVNALEAGSYTASIYAQGANGRSASVTISIAINLPEPPQIINSEASFDSIVLMPSNATGLNGGTYEYRYSLTPVADPSTAMYLAEGGSFTHNNLAYNTEYHYYIRTVNAYGASAYVYHAAATNADAQKIMEVISGEIKETDLYEDLQTEIGKIGDLETSVGDLEIAVGAITDPLEWDGNNQAYNEGDVVRYGTKLLYALQDVPQGIAPTNEAYWSDLGDYASIIDAVQGLTHDVSDLDSTVSIIDGKVTAQQTQTNALIAATRPARADGEKADSIRGWQTEASFVEETNVRADEDRALSERITVATARVGDNEAGLSSLEQVVADNDSAMAQRVSVVETRSGDNESNISTLEQTVADNDSAMSQRVDVLNAAARGQRADGEKADSLKGWQSEASFAEEINVRADEDRALSERITQANASVGENEAKLQTLEQTVADNDSAMAQRVSVVETRSGDNESNISSLEQTVADNDSAMAQRVAAVEVEAGDNTAAVQTTQQAVTDIENGLSATYNIKVGVTQNGTYYGAGMGIGIENTPSGMQSQVLFLANKFAIFDPATESETAPFIVSGGVSYLKNAMIQNGSIENAKIGNEIKSDNYAEDSNGDAIAGWALRKNGGLNIVDGSFSGILKVAKFDAPRVYIKSSTTETYGRSEALSVKDIPVLAGAAGQAESYDLFEFAMPSSITASEGDANFIATANGEIIRVSGFFLLKGGIFAFQYRRTLGDGSVTSWVTLSSAPEFQTGPYSGSFNQYIAVFNIVLADIASIADRGLEIRLARTYSFDNNNKARCFQINISATYSNL